MQRDGIRKRDEENTVIAALSELLPDVIKPGLTEA
jgi:hypothetical protein